jgi:HAE1 family hydrophobic/amphiphilic exporter-1
MGGIQGRLNEQFAMTIAIAVLISAFNALTLSPALTALLLRPRKESKGFAGRIFGGFNRGVARATSGYVEWSHALIRKAGLALVFLGAVAVADGLISRRLPASFLPEEDYGYAFLNVQLPAAASLARTDQVLKRVEAILGRTEGVRSYVTVGGFSLLTRISASYQGFFFVSFTPWEKRRSKQLAARAIVDRLNGTLATTVPEAAAFAFMPPSIPGLGNAGGFSLWLRIAAADRSSFSTSMFRRFSPRAGSVRSWRESRRSSPRPFRRSTRRWIGTRRYDRACRSPTSTRRSRPTSVDSF